MRLIVNTPRNNVVAAGIQGPGGPQGTPGPKGDPGSIVVPITNNSPPTSLQIGELEYSQPTNSLFLKTNIGIQKIAGADDATKLSLSTAFAYANTLVQRDNAGNSNFNLIQVNGITLNGAITSTSQNTNILTSALNQNIYIGSISSKFYTPAVSIKSNRAIPFEILDETDAVVFKVDNDGFVTANGLSFDAASVANIQVTTATISTANVVTLNGTIINANSLSASSASITGNTTIGGTLGVTGATTLTGVTVNGTTTLKGSVDGLNGASKSSLSNFSIDGNSNTIKLRTTIADLNTLAPGETALVGDKLYYMTTNGLRSFISADNVGNMQVGNVIIEGALKIDSTTSTGGLANLETTIDSFSVTDYRSAKYVVQVSANGEYQSSEVLVIHDGTQSYLTEYGFVQTNGTLCYLETRIEGGLVKLISVGLEDNLAYRVIRNTISV